ncbi:flavoprotein [Frondihabitans sucicola]|uniref:Flavoprotein n=1 Tax=Frondihabitans sucicola TaxID=1268041 RepID=A0ABM8GSK2_9MICO|nr:FAD-dependent oxidoreductase [Frondihabitans sucicola]BDZ51456.1 flavoprotein [Frondihabitans sucicola]
MTLTVPARHDASRLVGLPVAVIGAGPVGLAAAAHLLERGLDVLVLESGETAGSGVSSWGHVRLFSPWAEVVDPAAGRLLDAVGWDAPGATILPLGSDVVTEYLLPLAQTPALSAVIRYSSKVDAVSRQGMDKTRSQGRADVPFLLRVSTPTGPESLLARAVIDTSGTLSEANGLLSSGWNADADDASWLANAMPDVLGAERDRFAGHRVIVVGAGHSAANTLLALAKVKDTEPATEIVWVVRNANPVRVFGDGADGLEARGRLGTTTQDLVRHGVVELVDSFEIDDARPDGDGALLTGRRDGEPFELRGDVVVAATGFRPDLSILREIRLSLDDIVEAPRALAPLIDPNVHSCGTVPPHGVAELTQPEPNFFIAGMKSYGRAPTFLMLTGYEQVRSLADELAGNHDSARIVQLTLPETGVCSSGSGSSCCS